MYLPGDHRSFFKERSLTGSEPDLRAPYLSTSLAPCTVVSERGEEVADIEQDVGARECALHRAGLGCAPEEVIREPETDSNLVSSFMYDSALHSSPLDISDLRGMSLRGGQ